MDLAEYAMAAFVLIGLVNGVQFAINKQWESFLKFSIVVVAGFFFGLLGWFNLPSAEIGLAVGLSSSGAYKIAQRLGGK